MYLIIDTPRACLPGYTVSSPAVAVKTEKIGQTADYPQYFK